MPDETFATLDADRIKTVKRLFMTCVRELHIPGIRVTHQVTECRISGILCAPSSMERSAGNGVPVISQVLYAAQMDQRVSDENAWRSTT